jgi:hypothetical protein
MSIFQDISSSASSQDDCSSHRIDGRAYPMERRSLLRGLVATLLAWTTRRAQALLTPQTMSSSSTASQRISPLARPSALLVRIDMVVGKSRRYQRAVGDVVRRSLLNDLDVPKPNWFEVISEDSVERMPSHRPTCSFARFALPSLPMFQTRLDHSRLGPRWSTCSSPLVDPAAHWRCGRSTTHPQPQWQRI